MPEKLKVAVAGVGRMGQIHALHVLELAQETGCCELAALVDLDGDRARKVAADLGCQAPIFTSLEEFLEADVADATVVVSHREPPRARRCIDSRRPAHPTGKAANRNTRR